MEFFVPHASTPEEAEDVWQATRKFQTEGLGWEISDRRIYEIHYRHNGETLTATVGEPEPLTREEVLVILESQSFLVCTTNRGVLRGMPVLAGIPGRVVDFDAD